ncbi:MAG: exodeoxyribonuclease V subunit gamma, partial [Gammaproteobacteria bacterium]|nr:exodeoxyribonuclease V subunit gamma [Gammaproteobacteria bacterium]
MFVLHTSNRTENLLSHLAQVIDAQPLNSPFDKELFLIQSQGMERWLSQQLASQFGVWGNYHFYFPGNFVSEISAPFVGSSTAINYQREQMVWIIEQLLRDIEQEQIELFQVITDYLQGEGRGVRRFQLAQQLARIFDQYQMMRPDWLRAWSNGKLLGLMPGTSTEKWQSELWRRINQQFGDCHRGEIWQRAIDTIEKATELELREKLPQRISIFGLNTIPPLLLNLLKALSRQVDIHLYLLTPTQEYWGEGGSRRAQLEQSVNDDTTALNDHRLLLSLGEQAREFQKLMLEQVTFTHEFASYEMDDAVDGDES